MQLGMEVGLGPGNIVLDGDPVPPKWGTVAPTFQPMYCGQTARWIKMPLSTEVGLDPGDVVLDGDPAPPAQRRTAAPTFRPTLLWNSHPSQQLLSSCYRPICVLRAERR